MNTAPASSPAPSPPAPQGLRPRTVFGANVVNATLDLDAENPWPGLASYDEASRAFFHGREADAAELVRLIKLSPFVTFYGKSGLGKSSVLQAGVFPALRAAHFLPVHLRLDYADNAQLPLMEQAALRLWQEVEASGADAAVPEAGEPLWSYLQRRETPIWGTDNFPLTPVLVFDQFEEMFSRGGSPAHVSRLLDAIADFAADRLPHELTDDRDAVRRLNLQTQQYHVVLAFRSDFLAEVTAWVKRSNLPRHEALHLTAMPRDRAVQAVARAGAAVLEPGVAEQIVDFLLEREVKKTSRPPHEQGAHQKRHHDNDHDSDPDNDQDSGQDKKHGDQHGDKHDGVPTLAVPGNGDVEPALLSLCCYQLNRKRKRPGKIDAELLRTFGPSILADFYQEAVKDMPPSVPRFIEENLILGDRYRNPYPREVALSIGGGLTEGQLNHLTRNRLLRLDPQGDELRIELIHDRLVGVVRESRDARRAHEAREAERAAADKLQREALERVTRDREAAEQRVELEHERERTAATERERVREAVGRKRLLGAAFVMALMIAGLAVQSYRAWRANTALADKITELNDTATSVNNNLAAVKDEGEAARKALEEANTRVAKLELDLARVDEARSRPPLLAAAGSAGSGSTGTGGVGAGIASAGSAGGAVAGSAGRGTSPSGSVVTAAAAPAAYAVKAERVREAEERVQEQTAKAQAYEASRNALGRQPTYTIAGWRLASNGCGQGEVLVSGPATFIVMPRDGKVEVREVFNGRGDGFTVSIDSRVTLPAQNPGCYELPTVGTWTGPNRRFTTQGVDRVCVNPDGAPVSASIARVRTSCGY